MTTIAKPSTYRTGFCGNGEVCNDVHERCPGSIKNGSSIKQQITECACECHTEKKVVLHVPRTPPRPPAHPAPAPVRKAPPRPKR